MSDPLADVLLKQVQLDSANAEDAGDIHEYLAHIRGLSQSSIEAEREHLATSMANVEATLLSLTKRSQDQILSSGRVAKSLAADYHAFGASVKDLSERVLPDVEQTVKRTLEELKGESESAPSVGWESEAVMLLRHFDKIHDILELPYLTLTCVRNGYYSEALDLASHSRRLGIRYSNVKVIQQVQKEIDEAMHTMTLQLVKLLRESSKLPSLIKAVSYLRRLPPFQNLPDAPQQLQQLFLTSRLLFVRTEWSTLAPLKQTPDKYLKRYIEIYREHVFGTVGSFKTIFPDNPDEQTSSDSRDARVLHQLLAEFVQTTVSELRQTVAEYSALITNKTLRSSLWLQMVYCSQSLGRVGADFWPAVQGAANSGIQDDEWASAVTKQRSISRDIAQRLEKSY